MENPIPQPFSVGFDKTVNETDEAIRKTFERFLLDFKVGDEEIYKTQIDIMVGDSRNTIYVDFEHLINYGDDLASSLLQQYYRFDPCLRRGLRNVVRKLYPGYARDADDNLRDFWVSIYGIPTLYKVRELKTDKIGQLISISGTVTRTSEVRPELISATYFCLDCMTTIRDVDQQFKYTEPLTCPTPRCQNRRNWKLIVEQSKFADWQKIRVQENSSEIPAGSMPRSLDVIVRNEMVDRAKPGDKCVFTGTLIVLPDITQLMSTGRRAEVRAGKNRSKDSVDNEGVTGLKSLGVRELTYKMCFLATTVQPADSRQGSVNIREEEDTSDPNKIKSLFSTDELEEIREMKLDPDIYSKLANSIAPSVFGHETIKKGVLLMLFGGLQKETVGNLKLRGDINVCIVGDPSTAKSQFLKYVVSFLPRAVYTSGKASTAAGLTASVVRDDETGEFTIEAGALMLADNGVCCIDEFDKMDIADQVAIHEAMEQQTISIAKAGIQATLNARTSILAASNPHGGRYDVTKSLRSNIAMSAAIMSRFDLFFVVVDECNQSSDYNIAKHIVNMHQNPEETIQADYSTSALQRYIKFARSLKPKMTPEAAKLLVHYYRMLRQSDVSGPSRTSYRITVRQLESMIRLSEALARVHCSEDITTAFVDEAYYLLQKSIIHVQSEELVLEDNDRPISVERPNDDGPSKKRRVAEPEEPQNQDQPKKSVQISYEKYRSIAKMIVTHLRRNEQVEQSGMRKSEIIEWYLEQVEDTIDSQEKLAETQDIIKRVINRLVQTDNILLALRELATAKKTASTSVETEEDPLLVVHPNFVVE